MFGRKLSIGRFYVLKTIRELLLENHPAEYIEKRLVIDQINLYPEYIKQNLSMIWTPNALNDIIINLEKIGLIKSYNIKEKPQRKMLKVSKMGKNYLKDNETLYNFHNLPKKKKNGLKLNMVFDKNLNIN